ncbi:hypothetical protein [Agrococcus carbonis]|uniref:Signal peptidase I n=1 Tax=Agrococcus carbonis TaxID=684552 RepID=A0A1H1KY42_9MICO|nr:hypothetical protein [Agrococcus carbonis]SDR66599.1 hypothetical protein SAMN04489719_0200 [Agrococcus carbonis]
MRALRTAALILLGCLGLVGAAAAVLWSGSLAGLARAEVAGTDAMAPQYAAGDLLVVTRVPAERLEPGDVVSVPAGGTGATHLERIVSMERAPDGAWSMTTAVSAEREGTAHRIGAEAWAPTLRIPVVGTAVAAAASPAYAIPIAAGVLLLLAVVLVGRTPAAPVTRAA